MGIEMLKHHSWFYDSFECYAEISFIIVEKPKLFDLLCFFLEFAVNI